MRNRGKYYVLWFGPYKNKSIEQIMFMPGGTRYLRKLLTGDMTGIRKLHRPNMVMRIREVFRRGELLPVQATCSCGKGKATHISVLIDDRWMHTFGELLCGECKENVPPEKPSPLPIKFSSLYFVPADKATQERMLRQFKFSFFLNEKERITKRTAQKLFFPELYGGSDRSEPEPPGNPDGGQKIEEAEARSEKKSGKKSTKKKDGENTTQIEMFSGPLTV